jgi:hypothetical protein
MENAVPLPRRALPPMARVAQSLKSNHIPDVRADVRRKIDESGLLRDLRRGARVGITAGSRGMGGFVDLLAGIADAVRKQGGEPFILPAMGSHGGATAEGQTEILRRLGVTDDAVQAPIRATMETRALGACPTGAVAHLDEISAQADGVIVLGRVKTHPERATGLASGLLKMVTVGLGKQTGAQDAHSHGLWDSVEQVPAVTMAHAPILCGIAVVENARRQPVVIEVVPPKYDAFREADIRLLEVAHQHLATIPFDHLDLLIVDQLGKSISGTGMDLNVIGSWRMKGGEHKPDIRRIAPLSLTHPSLGNGLGIGLADFTTRRFMDEYDPQATYMNLLTAAEPDAMNTREGPLPLALPSDREAAEVALYSAIAGPNPRVCRIESTAALGEMWISESLLPEVERNRSLSVLESPVPLPFDAAGNLF